MSTFNRLPLGKILTLKGGRILDLTKPNIMGILNITPDSFSDGGQYLNVDKALQKASQMIKEGADIIDIGAESTRPYAKDISYQEELDRLLPIITAIKREFEIIISIDTYKAEVMKEVIKLDVDLINDVKALTYKDSIDIIAKANIPIILMHMLGTPKNMQIEPQYSNIIKDVYQFFLKRIDVCLQSGIKAHNILIDPGFGFGKTWYDNASLLRYLHEFTKLDFPIVVGMSRKSMIEQGNIGSVAISERLPASIALAVMAVIFGAKIIRCHDVLETKQACDMAFAIMEDGNCVDG